MKTASKFANFSAFAIIALTLNANAALVVWGGSAGEYTTPGNWVGGNLPNTGPGGNGDTAQINSGSVNYAAPAGDLQIRNGATLQVTGGSFIQSGGIAFMQFGGGNLNVSGGSFSMGTAGQMVRDANTSISLTGGTVSFNGNIGYNPAATGAFSVNGSIVNFTNEFQPQVPFTLSLGSMSATHLSFGGTGRFNLSGGTVSVNALSTFDGIFGADADSSLNFTTGSTGQFLIRNLTLAELNDPMSKPYLTNGKVTINGAVSMSPATDYLTVQSGNDVIVSLVPEPSSALLLLGGLGVLACKRRRA